MLWICDFHSMDCSKCMAYQRRGDVGAQAQICNNGILADIRSGLVFEKNDYINKDAVFVRVQRIIMN